MQTRGKVKQKLKQAAFRHRKRFVAEGLNREPRNCKWNDALKTPHGSEVRLCVYGQGSEDWNKVVCDPAFGGCEQAEVCEFFECRRTAEELKDEFENFAGMKGQVEMGRLSREYPDLAALLWVLSEGANDEETSS